MFRWVFLDIRKGQASKYAIFVLYVSRVTQVEKVHHAVSGVYISCTFGGRVNVHVLWCSFAGDHRLICFNHPALLKTDISKFVVRD